MDPLRYRMRDGSRINAFGSLEDTLFAGTDSGIFISRDEARSWVPATGVAMSSGRIISFATVERKVFAGTDGSGMLVSADEGKSWDRNVAFPSHKVRCLLAHQGRLYAGTDAEGVFVSSDAGQSWSSLKQEFPSHAQVFALSAVEGQLFAGLYGKGLYAWNEQEHRWTKAGRISPLFGWSEGAVHGSSGVRRLMFGWVMVQRSRNKVSNKPAVPNAGTASQLTVGHHWPGVGEPGQ